MWPFRRKVPRGFEPLAQRIENLELANAERQIAVLNTVEKLAKQFNARVRMRERSDAETDSTPPDIGAQPLPQGGHPDRFRIMGGR